MGAFLGWKILSFDLYTVIARVFPKQSINIQQIASPDKEHRDRLSADRQAMTNYNIINKEKSILL